MNFPKTTAAEKSVPYPAFVGPIVLPGLPLALLSLALLAVAEPRIPRVLALAARLFLAL